MSSALRGRLTALLLLLVPTLMIAQQVMGTRCTAHPNWQPSCSTDAQCDALWTAHRCSAHDECGSSPNSSVSAASFSLEGSPALVIAKSAILGGSIGALALSFSFDADSNNMAGVGAVLGFGTFMAAGVLKNRSRWGKFGSTLVGAAAGAAIGGGVGLLQDGKIEEGSAEDLTTDDKALPLAQTGAVIGAVTGFALDAFSPIRVAGAPLGARDRRVRLLNRGSRIGLSITW